MPGFPALMHLAHLLLVLTLHQTTLWSTVLTKTIHGTIHWICTTIASPSLDRERLAALRTRSHRPRLVW